jgi:LPXTG-site transpeptidase (sortase) family protein
MTDGGVVNFYISPKNPINIKIPAIGVDAAVESTGLTSDGAVGSPLGPINTAWFNMGPIPGAIGSAIIDGHSGWKDNVSAVFDDLNKLKIGDRIYIEDGTGRVFVFEVKKLKTYHKNDIALDVFWSKDNKSHLNLITCSGEWNIAEDGRDDRIVVFADLIE